MSNLCYNKKLIVLSILVFLFLSNAVFADTPRTMYVMNGSAETLSKMNMENGAVISDILTTGMWPNQILIHNDMIYLVNSGTDDIYVIDPSNDQQTEKVIALDTGYNPYHMTFVGSNTAYVTNSLANNVSVIDVETATVLKNIEVGSKPQGILYLGDPYFGDQVYVANTANIDWGVYGQGTVSVIDVSTDSVIHTLEVPTNPQKFAVDPYGNVHVLCTGDYATETAKIVIIYRYGGMDWSTPVVTDTIEIGDSPGDIAITPAGMGYCVSWGDGTNGFLYKYDALGKTVIHGNDNPILVGPNVSRLVYDEKENVFWIPYMAAWGGDGFVQKFDVTSDSIVWTSSVLGNGTQDIAILEPILDTTPGADEVLSFTPGANRIAFGDNFFPENVLGLPDQDPNLSPFNPSSKPQELLSLGHGGEIILLFSDNKIVNGDGPDFTVFENPFISFFDSSVNVEAAMVSVSQDGEQWLTFPYDTTTLTGLAGVTPTGDNLNPTDPSVSGGDQFDLSDVGLEWATYVKITDMNDLLMDSGDFDLDAVVAIHSSELTSIAQKETELPKEFTLHQNYPNPFNPETVISYSIQHRAPVELRIFNTLGQEVVKIVNQVQDAGTYQVTWDAKDTFGNQVVSGIYFYQLQFGKETSIRKMTLIR